jgi:lysophospholipase L1-like esterase
MDSPFSFHRNYRLGARYSRRDHHSLSMSVLTVLGLAVFSTSAYADNVHGAPGLDRNQRWIGTWATSPEAGTTSFDNQTLRLIVHTSIGGDNVRIRISNAYGTASLVIGAAHIALRSTGPQIVSTSDRVLTFSGQSSITIPPGALIVSDPVKLNVPTLGDLAVSIYLPDNTGSATFHAEGKQTSYISSTGDFTGSIAFPTSSTTLSSFFLTDVEVQAFKTASAIVTLGDSITDGTASTPDTNHRWPNFLADRLQASHRDHDRDLGVLDQGISGNRILHDIAGTNALARLDRDVFSQTGVQYATVLLGINDIGFSGITGFTDQAVSADDIIAGLTQIIERAHERGLTIFGCTLTPFEGTFPGYFTPEGEVKRETVNEWIRTSSLYDAVIDFDKAIRDPSHPTRMLPAYDSGDHLHPNDAGYMAMANAIDLSLFSQDEEVEEHVAP